jgi:hypothetical protein
MKIIGNKDRQRSARIFLFSGSILLLALASLEYVLSVQSKLRRASRPGRAVSASIAPTTKLLTTVTRSGTAGDPINLQLTGSNEQIATAFTAAGWYRADEIDFVTSVRISVDTILGRKYSTAPVSSLYLYGRKEDLAFERPGRNVRQRDHTRIWNTGHNGSDGRPIWIGSATKDTRVELAKTNHLPTHHIDSDVDAERALIVSELSLTGYIVQETTRPGFGKQTHGLNGEGDPYVTDGQIAVLTLANVATTPLVTQVRSPLTAGVTKQLAGLVRHRLPQAGLEHAARAQQSQAAQTAAD